MGDKLKPLLKELKDKLADPQELQKTISTNLSATRKLIQEKAKDIAIKNKDGRLVRDIVRPALESESAERAIKGIQEKLSIPLGTKLNKYRKMILEVTEPNVRRAEVVNEPPRENEKPAEPVSETDSEQESEQKKADQHDQSESSEGSKD